MLEEKLNRAEGLDPVEWESFRALGHRMLDDMVDYLRDSRERPVWKPMGAEQRRAFEGDLPLHGQEAEATYAEFLRDVLPYSMGNTHPRFWGWVMGNGTPLRMLADMLASGLNPNMGGGDHAPVYVEKQVIHWCKQMFDFPSGASGTLVSGGSVANLIGLAVARYARAGFDFRAKGASGSTAPQTVYGSSEMHSSLQKAVELMGIGNAYLRRISVDPDYRIQPDALRRRIEADRDAGLHPICIVGCAGTTNTGAIDPLEALADLAASEGLWYHVDGAFGALAYLVPELRPELSGLARADSLAFDLHKWVYLPFEVGCVLVRDEAAHQGAFALHPDYLVQSARGLASGPPWPSEYGIQLTRGFRALKVWMAFKTYGIDRIAQAIRTNVEQAAYLTGLIQASPRLELLAPTALNIVCFRYVSPGLDEAELNALNQEILFRLQESGAAVPSSTMLNNRLALRCSITNYRSREDDFDLLIERASALGDRILASK